jgi:hypothetical protein
LLITAGVLTVTGLLWLWSAEAASAQCGSQASSCKNCHETQGQDSVNAVGDWHVQHAFIDACVVCHAGNDQAVEKDAAHVAMAAPLADVQASCARCHPADTLEKAQIYAVALGVEVGTGGGAAAGGGSAPAPTAEPPAGSGGSTVVVEDQDVIDYAQQYDQTVTGQRDVNVGDVIVGTLLAVVVLGGGAYGFFNERRLRSRGQARPRANRQAAAPRPLDDYPADVLALVPYVAQLNPMGIHGLRRLLENPNEASELLHSLSRLDPELVKRIRSLDRDARSLLLALAGD